MKTKRFSVILTTAALLAAAPAFAEVHYERAEVVGVEPLYETVSVSVPQEVCREQEVAYRSPRRSSAVAPILGAVIGGAIGNAVGHKKRNKQVGVATGAILGGAIGADIGRRNAYERGGVRYRTEEVCHREQEIREEERQIGYRVSYRYAGETYTTRMDRDPGDSIRVRVAVSPVGR